MSAYIDEMLNTPHGSYYVENWNEDLKKLKHYRWVRNQIAHEPGCTERNMCDHEDELWIDNFYSRIMNQTDPLSLYHKATRKQTTKKSTSKTDQDTPVASRSFEYRTSKDHNTNNGSLTLLMIVLMIIIMGIIVITQIKP